MLCSYALQYFHSTISICLTLELEPQRSIPPETGSFDGNYEAINRYRDITPTTAEAPESVFSGGVQGTVENMPQDRALEAQARVLGLDDILLCILAFLYR